MNGCGGEPEYKVMVEQRGLIYTRRLQSMQYGITFHDLRPYTVTNIVVTAYKGNQTATSRIPPILSPEISM